MPEEAEIIGASEEAIGASRMTSAVTARRHRGGNSVTSPVAETGSIRIIAEDWMVSLKKRLQEMFKKRKGGPAGSNARSCLKDGHSKSAEC